MLAFWLLAACGGSPSTPAAAPAGSHPTTPTSLSAKSDIDVDALKAAQAGGITLIDVRTEQEYAGGHVPGAINIPIEGFDPQDVVQAAAFGDKSKPVYVICEVGGRSARGATMLASAGYPAVNVLGGTAAWREKGFPLDK